MLTSTIEFLNRQTTIQWVKRRIHFVVLIPLAILIFDYFTNHLTFNPIQAASQRTGRIAITLLTITLSGTPLFTITGVRLFSSLRKPLGLYSFLYASIHLLIFLVADYNLDWKEIYREFSQKPYLIIGLGSFLILSSLAITSFAQAKIILKKNWKRLHRMVYLVGIMVAIHFLLSLKGNILTGSGNILEPVYYLAVILTLLVFRIPVIKRRLHLFQMVISKKQVEDHAMIAGDRPDDVHRGLSGWFMGLKIKKD